MTRDYVRDTSQIRPTKVIWTITTTTTISAPGDRRETPDTWETRSLILGY